MARMSRIRTGTPGRRTEHGGDTRDRVGRLGRHRTQGWNSEHHATVSLGVSAEY